MDVLKDEWFEASYAVWDRLAMAEIFTHVARLRGAPCMRLEWFVNGAAGGLWAAVDIINHRIASEATERLGTSPTSWFEEHEPLVYEIRNGAVHFSHHHGVGRAVQQIAGAEPELVKFIWVERDFDGNYGSFIPLEEALSRFDAVREHVEAHLTAVTGQEKFRVHLPGPLIEDDDAPLAGAR